jgi:thiamine biosynthesis lipoprotein
VIPHELSFDAMGCAIRLIVDEPLDASRPAPAVSADKSRRWLAEFDARMSRFRPDSELCALNRDPHEAFHASALLRATVRAALWAARHTDGLVDPTLIGDLERVGYERSLAGVEPAPLAEALAAAPARAPAAPSPEAHWRLVSVDDEAGVIHRPPGIRLDSGGAGKGLAADAVAHRLSGYSRVAIDCGGDVRVAGAATRTSPFDVEILHPLTGAPAYEFALGDGAVATSGIGTRIWRTADGGYAHHLLDPSTGRPAWTGLIQATAIGTSALEAETLSKAALLSGPEAAREILAPLGGALIHDDGEVELIGSLRFEEVAA